MATLDVTYIQYRGVTLASMIDGRLEGLAAVREGDKFNKPLGIAIALVKAGKRIPKHEGHFLESIKAGVPTKSFRITKDELSEIMYAQQAYRAQIGKNLNSFETVKQGFGIRKVVVGYSGDNIYVYRKGHEYVVSRKQFIEFLEERRTPFDAVDAELIGKALLSKLDRLGK